MMLLETSAVVEAVTVDEVKQYLKIDHELEDDLIATLISAARVQLETRFCLAFISQIWGIYVDGGAVGKDIKIDKWPVKQILKAEKISENGDATPLRKTDAELVMVGKQSKIKIHEAVDGQLYVQCELGFGHSSQSVPADIRHALMTLVAYWYEDRAHLEHGFHSHIPNTILSMLSHYKTMKIGG